VFVDSDVILDVLIDRQPFNVDANQVFVHAEMGRINVMTSPLCVANAHYLVSKKIGNANSKSVLASVLRLITVVDMPADVVQNALASKVIDFEDALQTETAIHCGADVIVTRNIKDFRHSPIPVLTPSQFLAAFANLPDRG
jgi:predicted nucleic acid-binding protein